MMRTKTRASRPRQRSFDAANQTAVGTFSIQHSPFSISQPLFIFPKHTLEIGRLRLAQARPQVADFTEPRRRGGDREVLRIHARVHLLPRQRRRDAGEVAGARAVGGRQRLAEDVLQVVDVDRAARPRARPCARPSPPSDAASPPPSRRSGRRACPIRTTCPAAAECRCAGRSSPTSSGQPGTFSASSSSCTQRATSSTRENGVSSSGSRSMRHVVGVERRLHAREPRVLRDRGDLRHVEQRDQRSADERRASGSEIGSMPPAIVSMRTPGGGFS